MKLSQTSATESNNFIRVQNKLAIIVATSSMLKIERLVEGRKPKIFRLFVLTKVKNQ